MSVIKNTGIKRGDELKSVELNAEFTAVNTAFKMDADNFRNEAIDQAAMNLHASHGKSGIILLQTGSTDLITSSTNIDANENAVASMVAPTQLGVIGGGAPVIIVAKDTNIFRVYWQHRFNTGATTLKSLPYASSKCGLCWAIWLEWQLSSGGSWVQVPGQGNMETALDPLAASGGYGSKTVDMKATSLDFHSLDFKGTSPATFQVFPGERSGYGQYYYKFASDTNIYGLRLMCRGLYEPCFPLSSVQKNSVRITQAAAPSSPAVYNNRLVIQSLQLSYLLMRNE
tara:strand:+ start:10993 stop:11847 length:855 start_codon:yes stop_codon:yes gene_type:complete